MKIYFDYQIFYFQKYGGISKYFVELAGELNKIDGCEAQILAPFHASAYLSDPQKSSLNFNLGSIRKKIYHNRFRDKRVEFNHELTSKLCASPDVILHETYYTDRIPVNSKKIVTVHDMIYELFDSGLGDREQTIKNKKEAMAESSAIIAVSENTRKDILRFYPEFSKKVHVVHHGVKQINEARPYKHSKPFLLHVGTRGWYKNFEWLLKIFGEQKRLHENLDLISFGGGSPSENEKRLLQEYNLNGKVHFLSGPEEMLDSLYRGARTLVYISDYEGFGMPLLEAMAAGCPVLCSNTSSVPEVVGDAALMVDAKKEAELSLALTEISNNEFIRRRLIDAGKSRAAVFTWKKCAEETFKIYQKIL